MGSVFSQDASAARGKAGGQGSSASSGNAASTTDPLGSSDAIDEAEWSQEGTCQRFQRFVGLLPRSKSDDLKRQQAIAEYTPRTAGVVIVMAQQANAATTIQGMARRYLIMKKWHFAGRSMLEIARVRLEERRAAEAEEALLAEFRQVLSTGFPAQKVSVSGELKNVQLQLVLKPDKEECYLTWSPSRKRQPRLHLHDIEAVVPVLKEGNELAPKLAAKVSHRRGFIVICKSHHRGRVILQVGTKQERKLLLLGFKRLLEEMNQDQPDFDITGALRRCAPRRQSALQFFDMQRRTSNSVLNSGNSDDADIAAKDDKSSGENGRPVLASRKSSKNSTDFAAIESFYQTRFDDPAADPSAAKQTTLRQSSTVTKTEYQ